MSKRSFEEEERSGNKQRRYNEGPFPDLYQVFHGQVATVKDYGIFVKIPGTSRQGLVHKSQISKSKVEDASEMFDKGERIYCKVITIDKEAEKIGLAMKMINQTTGQDEDPNNVELGQDERKRKQGFSRHGRPKIELDAVFNTTCKKCGGTGHLAQDCFQTGEGSYDLIPDLDEYMQTVGPSDKPSDKQSTSKHHKEKKRKKEKRKKKKRTSSSSDSSEEEKKHKKKKKRKHSRAASSSDTDSDTPRKKHKSKKKHSKRRHSSSSSEGDKTRGRK